MEDEKRAINAIFWQVLAFAFCVLMISVGATWAYLLWAGVLESGPLWPGLLIFGIGLLGAIGCFAGIVTWLVRQARR